LRELLTILAGLVLLVLVAALAAPGFVDWGQYRAEIERRLSDAAGIEVVTTGPIGIRLLPSPRIVVDGVRLGDADPAGTRVVAGEIAAELALGPLLRGEARLTEMRLDRARLSLALREGRVATPERWAGAALPTSFARLELTRSSLELVGPDAAPMLSLPIALIATTPGPGGPLRIEGEVAGRSLRLTTGDADAAGALRMKAYLTGPALRHEFDGAIALPFAAGAVTPRLVGRISLVGPAGEDGQPALSASAQVDAAAAAIRLENLIVDLAGAGRLEGEGSWSEPGAASSTPLVTLRTRRIDAGAVTERWSMLREQIGREGLGTPARAMRLDFTADQLAFRGEEATQARLVALFRTDSRLVAESGALSFAGVQLALAPGDAGSTAFTVQSADLRRLALALQRLGVDNALADDLASLRDIAFTAQAPTSAGSEGAPTAWRAQGHFGRAEGSFRRAGGGHALEVGLTGVDLLALARPAQALARLAVDIGSAPALSPLQLGPIEIQARSDTARLGDSPAGSLRLAARLTGDGLAVRRLQLNGFDGVTLAIDEPAAAGGPGLISLSAARADAIGQLAARLTGDPALTRALVALKGLSPVRLDGSLTRGPRDLLTLSGRLGAMQAIVDVATRPDRSLEALSVRAEAERAVLFRALGLPPPVAARAPTELALSRDGGLTSLALTGADGLSLTANGLALDEAGTWRAPFRIAAPTLAAALPPFALGGVAGDAIEAAGHVTIRPDAVAIEGLQARIGTRAVDGALVWRPEGSLTGQLTLPAVDLEALARDVIGAGPLLDGPAEARVWSGARFALPPNAAAPPEFDMTLASSAFGLGEAGAWAGRLRLTRASGALRVSEASLGREGLQAVGSASLERQGSQVSLRVTGTLKGIGLTQATGAALTGIADLDVQFGASGESPARLAASLSGAVEARLSDVVATRFAPDALDRITAAAMLDTVLEDAAQLAANVRRQVESAPWALGGRTTSGVLSGGVLRFAPITVQREGRSASFTAVHDIRQRVIEIRSSMTLDAAPRGWTGPAPQLGVTTRGPWGAASRSYDVSALGNALSQRALQREINRVEAMEADIRERAMFNRRLRSDRERERREAEERAAQERLAREQTEKEQAAREQAAREQAAREQGIRDLLLREEPPRGLAPPLPAPLIINPLPAPLSRPGPPLN
jgi:hypothetical protein